MEGQSSSRHWSSSARKGEGSPPWRIGPASMSEPWTLRDGATTTLSLPDQGQLSVYLIADEMSIRTEVANYLEDNGIRVVAANNAQTARRQLVTWVPNLVILDLNPHHESGLDAVRTIRSCCDAPIIVTGRLGCSETYRAEALDLGADDCIANTVGPRELLARIRAILRGREAARAASARKPRQARYKFGGWSLDGRLRRLTSPSGMPVALSKAQYALLVAFLDSPQRPLTRLDLMLMTSEHEDCFDRSVDVRVLRLRRKLETDPGAMPIIRTERGVGYTFALPVERSCSWQSDADQMAE
jgi:two-component system, OmpR family, response regulator